MITFHDVSLAKRITREARRLNKDIPIIVRTRDDHFLEELETIGASVVVPESLESSLNVATRTLEQLDVDHEEILRLIDKARSSHFRRLRGVFHGNDIEDLDEYHEEWLHTIVLSAHDFAVGLTLEQLQFEDCIVEVDAIKRHGVRGEAPDPSLKLEEGDALVLRGLAEHTKQAEKRLLTGHGVLAGKKL